MAFAAFSIDPDKDSEEVDFQELVIFFLIQNNSSLSILFIAIL